MSSPLTAFSDTVSGSAISPKDADTDVEFGVDSPDTVDDPASVHQLSQQAWDQLHPEQTADTSTADSSGNASFSTGGSGGGGAGAGDVGTVPTMPAGDAEFGNPAGGNYLTDNATKAEKIVNFAKSMLGVPYVWGGNSRQGTDCSGLVQQAYRAAGIDMPRLSNYQMNKGKRVAYKDLRPGDLVGWNNSDHVVGADHIAIYIGNNQIIEAARPGTDIRVSGLFDYDVGQMWGVRLPGMHVAPQRSTPAAPRQAATQVRTSGGSNRAVEAASAAAAKAARKKSSTSSPPRRMSLE